MKAYTVVFNWNYEDDTDYDIHIFDTYEKALNCFNRTIKEEMTNSWIGDHLTEGGEIDSEYCEVDTNVNEQDGKEISLYWTVKNNWTSSYDRLELFILEVE